MAEHEEVVRAVIPFTPETERNFRREHERLHPNGLMRSGRICDVCLLLAALTEERNSAINYRRAIPRCGSVTARGYRCARTTGHDGAHSHPRDKAGAA